MSSPGGSCPARSQSDLEEGTSFSPRFGAGGLMPCVASDARTGAVLMLAWMNKEALELTLASGFAHYWSRSRQRIWKKGETSGALQQVVEVLTDCDQDALLLRVRVDRPQETCHTGRPTCFYRVVTTGEANGPRGLTFVR